MAFRRFRLADLTFGRFSPAAALGAMHSPATPAPPARPEQPAPSVLQSLNQINRRLDRVLMELTNVDSLSNDNDVTVTTYRGRDGLLTDATGNGFMPGGTQRADDRWGKQFVMRFKGL